MRHRLPLHPAQRREHQPDARPMPRSSIECARFVAEETLRYAEIIRRAGIRAG